MVERAPAGVRGTITGRKSTRGTKPLSPRIRQRHGVRSAAMVLAENSKLDSVVALACIPVGQVPADRHTKVFMAAPPALPNFRRPPVLAVLLVRSLLIRLGRTVLGTTLETLAYPVPGPAVGPADAGDACRWLLAARAARGPAPHWSCPPGNRKRHFFGIHRCGGGIIRQGSNGLILQGALTACAARTEGDPCCQNQ
ncbi:hypothetical protein ABZ478_04900 [Streptomyces sp. NPDC005706]|uniref:hypothetical protein n=1 Tax=Streptomyces sp. NPDC005706 TaxID=3157169 RepID=UPI0033D181AF